MTNLVRKMKSAGETGPAAVACKMSDSVRAAIERIGRTEDAQFTPSGKRVAIAGFGHDRILVLELAVELGVVANVTFERFLEVESAALALPHGIFWLDEETLIVANRRAEVAIFAVPTGTGQSSIKLDPLRTLGSEHLIRSPGSVSAVTIAPGVVELLVCNNYVHTISRHLLDRHANFEPVASEILLKQGLEVPDGIAQSASGRWIAVSNHYRNAVFLYRNDGALDRASKPAGVLSGIKYPHGVRFSPDERSVLVADAGSPFVHIFRSDETEWFGARTTSEKIQVVGDDDFARGHFSDDEGGPKGIDLTHDGGLLIASCEERPLAIFDTRAMLRGTSRPIAQLEAIRAREAVLRYRSASTNPIRNAARLAVGDLRHWAGLSAITARWRIASAVSTVRRRLGKRTG